jgi:hypothetical protein
VTVTEAAAVRLFRGGMEKTAMISDDGLYRYALTRRWRGGAGNWIVWAMLNPSTADANVDDPTIRRCVSFSRSWGYAGLAVINVFALRATEPRALALGTHPRGPLCESVGRQWIDRSAMIVAAWGAHKMVTKANWVTDFCENQGRTLACLGTTKSGAPRHPLYVPASQPLVEYRPC